MSDLVPTGDLYPSTYVPNNPYEYDAYKGVPSYLEPVPEYGPSNSVRDRVDRTWSYIARYPRYIALAFMFVTYTVYRFVFVLGTAVLLVYLILNR